MTKKEVEKRVEKVNSHNDRVNIFNELNAINVNEHVEPKGNFNYLSWTWAWSEIMKRYPNSYSTVYETEDGMNYFTDGHTAWVKVGFTIVDDINPEAIKVPNGKKVKEYIEYYPVYDFRHKSLPIEKVTSHDVNTAIQRGMTKAIARHGLGLYIYAGEDLPNNEKEEIKNANQEKVLAEYTSLRTKLTDLDFDFRDEEKHAWIIKRANVKNQESTLSVPEMERLNETYKYVIEQVEMKKEKEGK